MIWFQSQNWSAQSAKHKQSILFCFIHHTWWNIFQPQWWSAHAHSTNVHFQILQTHCFSIQLQCWRAFAHCTQASFSHDAESLMSIATTCKQYVLIFSHAEALTRIALKCISKWLHIYFSIQHKCWNANAHRTIVQLKFFMFLYQQKMLKR